MKSETKIWLDYAEENLKSSKILLDNKLYNPSLQNAQQSVEKALKAIFIEYEINLKRTHDILELKYLLQRKDIIVNISDDECDLTKCHIFTVKVSYGRYHRWDRSRWWIVPHLNRYCWKGFCVSDRFNKVNTLWFGW